MTHGVFQDFWPSFRRRDARILAFSFLAGLVFGISVFLGMEPSLFPMMPGILTDSLSIVRLNLTLLIPLLVSLFAFFADTVLLFPICFVRAFLFAFVHMALLSCFGPSGWMIRWLVLFSDCVSLPVLYFSWHRRLLSCSSGMDTILLEAALLCVIGFFDFYVVTPFGAELLILQKG